MSKRQLHVSGLNTLAKCGVQFEFRYERGIKIAPDVGLTIGKAVDAAVTADLGNKISTGQLLPAEQVQDIARDAVVQGFREEIDLEADYIELGSERAQADAIDTSVSLARLHHVAAAPRIQPTHVQRPWVLDIEGLPIRLAGTIDVQEGSSAIRDTKTSGKSPSADTAAQSLQLTTYALAAKAHDGQIPDRLWLDYLVHTKTPKLVQLESTRSEQQFSHLLERVFQANRIIESGMYSPAPIDSWWCSAKWCGYFRICRYAAGPVSVSVPRASLQEQLETSLSFAI